MYPEYQSWWPAILVIGMGSSLYFGVVRMTISGAGLALWATMVGLGLVRSDLRDLATVSGLLAGALAVMGVFVLVQAAADEVVLNRWRRRREQALVGTDATRITAESGWRPWFAWHPVRTELGLAWLRIVEMRVQVRGSCSETAVSWDEYREVAV